RRGQTVVVVTGRAGEAAQRAARILAAARPKHVRPRVLVDEVTAGLLDATFDLRGEAPFHELRGVRARFDPGRTLLGRPTPCVGRDRELAMLDTVLDQCIADSVARAVLVTAPPGFGKSRLRHEFLQRVAEQGGAAPEVWIGRGDPMTAGSPFGMIAQIVR